MRVKISEVQATLEAIVSNRSKLSAQEAAVLASDYLEGELQGKPSHGVAAFTATIEKLHEASGEYKILKETESFLYIDAEGSFGALVGRSVSDRLVEKAKKQGVAVASIRQMKSWLRPASTALHIANQDMLGWVMNTGGPPMVSPPGGKEPVIGTNPISLGIPMENEALVIDMATATRAWGEVRLAKRFKHTLPENAYLDSDGVVTIDPEAAYSALSFGGHKGFGLGLFVELLGGSLVDMNMGKGDVNEPYHMRNRGATIIVINPDLTVGAGAFKKQTQTFIDSIQQGPVAKNSEGIAIPGKRSAKKKQENLANGYLEIEDNLWKEIVEELPN